MMNYLTALSIFCLLPGYENLQKNQYVFDATNHSTIYTKTYEKLDQTFPYRKIFMVKILPNELQNFHSTESYL